MSLEQRQPKLEDDGQMAIEHCAREQGTIRWSMGGGWWAVGGHVW